MTPQSARAAACATNVHVAPKHQRIADLVKCGTHRLNVRRVDMVLPERHRCSLSGRGGRYESVISMGAIKISKWGSGGNASGR
jgi:hypothetical protein